MNDDDDYEDIGDDDLDGKRVRPFSSPLLGGGGGWFQFVHTLQIWKSCMKALEEKNPTWMIDMAVKKPGHPTYEIGRRRTNI